MCFIFWTSKLRLTLQAAVFNNRLTLCFPVFDWATHPTSSNSFSAFSFDSKLLVRLVLWPQWWAVLSLPSTTPLIKSSSIFCTYPTGKKVSRACSKPLSGAKTPIWRPAATAKAIIAYLLGLLIDQWFRDGKARETAMPKTEMWWLFVCPIRPRRSFSSPVFLSSFKITSKIPLINWFALGCAVTFREFNVLVDGHLHGDVRNCVNSAMANWI